MTQTTTAVPAPYVCRWGILEFAQDLLLPPATRTVTDITHLLVAAASSTSLPRAQAFLASLPCPHARAYGSYASLVADPDVDVVYIASPHSHHFRHTLMALRAGKHVLCEKPITVNEAQLRVLAEEARRRGRVLVEGLWTRFFPLCKEVRGLVEGGVVGGVVRVEAEVAEVRGLEAGGRLVEPELAGGALLDLGIYALSWIFLALYDPHGADPEIASTLTLFPPTGVDVENKVVLKFPTGGVGVARSSFLSTTDATQPAIRIVGTEGEIQVAYPAYRPEGFVVAGKDGGRREYRFPVPAGGHGLFWEADEVARKVRDGRVCGVMGGDGEKWSGVAVEESLVVLRAMDKVRRDGGVQYPEEVESADLGRWGMGEGE